MRGRVVAVAAVAGAVVLGFVAAGASQRGERVPPRTDTAARPASTSQPPSTRPPEKEGAESVTGGHDRSEEGARRAAIAFATASQEWLYLTNQEIDRSVRVIATPSAGPSLSTEAVAELGSARDALATSPGPVWWLVRPLASRVDRYAPASARVTVWTVTVLSAADVALPQADWVRVAVELQWGEDGWRVQSISDTPGPTPMTGTKDHPWQPEPLADALAGFQREGTEVPGT